MFPRAFITIMNVSDRDVKLVSEYPEEVLSKWNTRGEKILPALTLIYFVLGLARTGGFPVTRKFD